MAGSTNPRTSTWLGCGLTRTTRGASRESTPTAPPGRRRPPHRVAELHVVGLGHAGPNSAREQRHQIRPVPADRVSTASRSALLLTIRLSGNPRNPPCPPRHAADRRCSSSRIGPRSTAPSSIPASPLEANTYTRCGPPPSTAPPPRTCRTRDRRGAPQGRDSGSSPSGKARAAPTRRADPRAGHPCPADPWNRSWHEYGPRRARRVRSLRIKRP